MGDQETAHAFGPWLRRVREARGMSASKLCRTLDMAWSHYHAMEKGKYGAPRDFDRLRLIADELNLDPLEVYGRAGAVPPDLVELVMRNFEEWFELRRQMQWNMPPRAASS